MKPIIKIENLSKQYRLGTIGTGTVSNDLNRWWSKVRGKEDPFLKIGEANDRALKGNSELVWALKDINLEVMPGEVVGIIGRNGAGKSTLLKILSKVTGPTTGMINYDGRIGSLLEVGTGFHPELTGRENIFLNGAILGMTKLEIRSKLDEIIDFSGCERYIDTPVKRYSSGMKVRLGFAVAAHLEPEILVVDEVLAVGDAEFQKKAIGKMQDVSRNHGRTVLFVSHSMSSIKALCSRCVILENGVVGYDGNVENGINYYLEGGKKDDGKIIESLELFRKGIDIELVKVNGSCDRNIVISNEDLCIEIEINGVLHEERKMAIEVDLFDIYNNKLGIYYPSTFSGVTKVYGEGNFTILERIFIPKIINGGIFHLNICLTEPQVEYIARMSNCASIEMEGFQTITGYKLDYTSVGLLSLEGESL